MPRARGTVQVKPVRHHPRQGRRHHRPQPDEQTLHAVALRVLLIRQHVRHQRPQRLHGDIDRSIENPQQTRRHPERRGIRHQHQREGSQQSPVKQKRTPPSQPAPRVIAHVADDRLHQQSRQRRRQPKHGNLVRFGPQIFVDGAHVRHLQAEAKLDPQKPETHVPNLPKIQARFLHESVCRNVYVRVR